MSEKTELIRIKEDGSLDDDVYILLGPYSLASPTRNLNDLTKFLKISKGLQGSPRYFFDKEMTDELNGENYVAKKDRALGGKLYFVLQSG